MRTYFELSHLCVDKIGIFGANCLEDLCGVVETASAQIDLAFHISAQKKVEQFAFEVIELFLCGDMVESKDAQIARAVHISAQML